MCRTSDCSVEDEWLCVTAKPVKVILQSQRGSHLEFTVTKFFQLTHEENMSRPLYSKSGHCLWVYVHGELPTAFSSLFLAAWLTSCLAKSWQKFPFLITSIRISRNTFRETKIHLLTKLVLDDFRPFPVPKKGIALSSNWSTSQHCFISS